MIIVEITVLKLIFVVILGKSFRNSYRTHA